MLWARLLVGVGFTYAGVIHILDMHREAELFGAQAGWQSWPVVGDWRPLQVVLWLAFAEFFLGVFLFGGLLLRILSAPAAIVAGLQVAAVGVTGGWLSPLLLVGSLALLLRGGGSGTMDATLGKMQQRSLERELERQALRNAERQSSEG